MVEYALLVALLALMAIASMRPVGDAVNSGFCRAGEQRYDKDLGKCVANPPEE